MRFFALFSEERQKKLHEMKARNWQKIIILKRRSFFTVCVQNIMLIPNFHFLPFCLRAMTQNTSFFSHEQTWNYRSKTYQLKSPGSRKRKPWSEAIILMCYANFSISNLEFLSITNYVSSLSYKGCNSNWQLYKTFTLKTVNLGSGSVLKEFACS